MASHLAALATRLSGLSIGVPGTSLFYGSLATVPDGAGPVVLLREIPGLAPWGVHNEGQAAIRRPFVQVTVRGTDYTAVETKAAAVYAALTFVEVTVGGVRFLRCCPLQEPSDLGVDGNGRVRIGFNVAIERQA